MIEVEFNLDEELIAESVGDIEKVSIDPYAQLLSGSFCLNSCSIGC